MFDFFKTIKRKVEKAKDFNNSGRIMSFLNIEIAKFDNPTNLYSTKPFELLSLVYFAKVGVIEKQEKWNWRMSSKIFIPSFGLLHQVDFLYAYSQIVDRLIGYAEKLNLSSEVNEILNNGKLYYELKKQYPNEYMEELYKEQNPSHTFRR